MARMAKHYYKLAGNWQHSPETLLNDKSPSDSLWCTHASIISDASQALLSKYIYLLCTPNVRQTNESNKAQQARVSILSEFAENASDYSVAIQPESSFGARSWMPLHIKSEPKMPILCLHSFCAGMFLLWHATMHFFCNQFKRNYYKYWSSCGEKRNCSQ